MKNQGLPGILLKGAVWGGNRSFSFLYLGRVLTMVLFLAAASCASTPEPEQTPLNFSGFLENYSGFEPAPDGSGALVYLNPDRNLKRYTKVMIDPLVVWHSPDAEYKGINSAELMRLALTFQNRMVVALDSGYAIVYNPGPDVLRIRAAITDVVPAKPSLETPGPLLPMANDLVLMMSKKVADADLYLVPGTHLYVGQAAIEVELLDSETNERLVGYIERRKKSKLYAKTDRASLGPVIEIFDYWAKKLRQRLDEERGVREYQKEIQ